MKNPYLLISKEVANKKQNLFTTCLVVITLTLSACGGGGGGGGGGGPDITQPPPTQQPAPQPGGGGGGGNPPPVVPPPTVTVVPPPAQTANNFDICRYRGFGRPDTECYGGFPGFQELRDNVAELFSSGTNSDSDKKELLIIERRDGSHKVEVLKVANLLNNGVGGTISTAIALSNDEVNTASNRGDYSTTDIISMSSGICIGTHSPNCLDPTLFTNPSQRIIFVFPTGNNPTPGEDVMSVNLRHVGASEAEISNAIENNGKGLVMFVWGVNVTGDGIHPQSSTCHEITKNHCIGTPYTVIDSATATYDPVTDSYTATGVVGGTSFATPTFAVALKLAMELDGTVDPADLIIIACRTATDLGPSGNDATYGCGIANFVDFFDQFGNFVGYNNIPGFPSPSTSFNTAVVDPNTNYLPTNLLKDGGSKSQKFALSYDGETNLASICVKIFCAFYSDEDKSFQKGLLFSTESAFAGVFIENKKNDFFGGSGTEGSRSDYNGVDYIKGSAGLETKLKPYDISMRFDIAKGSAEGGGRIDHLDGIQNKFALTAERSFGKHSVGSFFVNLSDFHGSAGISGANHDLSHDEIKLGLQFGYYF